MNAKINASGEKCIPATGEGCLCASVSCLLCSTKIGATVTLAVSGVTGQAAAQLNGTIILTQTAACLWTRTVFVGGDQINHNFIVSLSTVAIPGGPIPTPNFLVQLSRFGATTSVGNFAAAGLAAPGGQIDCVGELPKAIPFLAQTGPNNDYSGATVSAS